MHRRPRVAIMATGDELRPVGEPLGPASIPDSNSESLAAQVLAAGAEPVRLGIAIDDRGGRPRARRGGHPRGGRARRHAAASRSAPATSSRRSSRRSATLDLWRVAIQPGKPLAYGSAPRPDGGTCLLFGLPGNPVSSFVTFELFVRPVLRRLRGEAPAPRAASTRACACSTRRSPSRSRVGPSSASASPRQPDEAGRYRAALAGGQGSHVLSALAAGQRPGHHPRGRRRPSGRSRSGGHQA